MKTTPVTHDDLSRSVISVPPLCRRDDLSIDHEENTKLIRHIEGGGVTTLLYGGNANLYNIAVSEYGALLDFLQDTAAPDTWMVPSVGPYYGNIIDQADVLKGSGFPTAMILPTLFPATHEGVKIAVRAFAERSGLPAVLYIKDESYLSPEAAAELVGDGIISWIKYAVVREDTATDPYLDKLIDLVDPKMIVSGIGEQPAPVHLGKFGVGGFTSGCVCVNPSLSMGMLHALQAGNEARAEEIRETFQPLEDLRNTHGPIPVLHHAVGLAGIAETGKMLPLLTALREEICEPIRAAAVALNS